MIFFVLKKNLFFLLSTTVRLISTEARGNLRYAGTGGGGRVERLDDPTMAM